MASRSSANWNSEMYQGSRRGRAIMGDFGHEMFADTKYEKTDILEDPEQLYQDRRDTLRDFTPDKNTLFAHEEPRRTTYGAIRTTIAEAGSRWNLEPWQNEDYDTQFHDKDPRGWSTEQPWEEYRRQAEAQFRMIDFKDDGDYSVPTGVIHPNELYKRIRGAQDWTKARLKIFETSWENMHPGGVGTYANVSNVFKSDYEDSSVLTDGTGMSRTFEDPEIRQHHTMKLSNVVHGGSAALRVNTTTDHKVPVAAYGKLYRNMGLINHETQMRLLEDDTPWSRIEGANTTPRNLIKLMSNYVHQAKYDDGNFGDGPTAAAGIRAALQDAAGSGAPGQEKFKGNRGDELKNQNRNNIVTKDILALLGLTENELKSIESYRAKNPKHADLMLANVYNLAEVVHKLPANVKLEMRNELILRSAGMGLIPGTGSQLRKAQDQVVVNPKLIKMMDLMVRKTEKPGAPGENRKGAEADSEGKLKNKMASMPVFVYKSVLRSTEDIDENRRAGGESEAARAAGKKEAKTHSYANLKKFAQRMDRNTRAAKNAQLLGDTDASLTYKNRNKGDDDFMEVLQQGVVDVEFGENKALTRHIGRVGTKQMRKHVVTDFFTYDQMGEKGDADMKRKNSKNRNPRTK